MGYPLTYVLLSLELVGIQGFVRHDGVYEMAKKSSPPGLQVVPGTGTAGTARTAADGAGECAG